MFKLIQQKLKESLILDENEPILSLIHVSDYIKQQNKKVRDDTAALSPASKKFILLASSITLVLYIYFVDLVNYFNSNLNLSQTC